MPSIQDSKEIPVKKIVLSALAVAAFAGSTYGQASTFGLDLWLAPRATTTAIPNAGAWTGTVSDIAGPVVLAPGQSVRLELRYRITDSNGLDDGFGSTGLISSSLNVTTGLSSAFGTFERPGGGGDFGARLTNNQRQGIAQGGTQPAFPADASNSGIAPINFGLHAPFRTGVFPSSNGTAVPGSLEISNILPITPAAPSHLSFDDNGLQNPTFWAVYSFQYTAPAVVNSAFVVPITVSTDGAASLFSLFDAGQGSETATAFGAGRSFSTSLSISVTPAPGAAALLGLGGLVAARRRRA
jgi:MYXO-CTERM domain-containing protein